MDFRPRRLISGILVVFSLVLMLAAPESRAGLVMLVVAALVELAGVLLDRRR